MSINYVQKDITTVTKGIIVHGVNCQNAMGSGIAKALYTKWPEVKKQYHKVTEVLLINSSPQELLGNSHAFVIEPGLYIMNGWTQLYYGKDPGVKYASTKAINSVIEYAIAFADGMNLPLYMPKIGCGLGGLNWEADVKPIVEKWAETFSDVQIFVCEI